MTAAVIVFVIAAASAIPLGNYLRSVKDSGPTSRRHQAPSTHNSKDGQ